MQWFLYFNYHKNIKFDCLHNSSRNEKNAVRTPNFETAGKIKYKYTNTTILMEYCICYAYSVSLSMSV